MERTPLDVISILGAMYVLTVTVWAICIPSIQGRVSARKKLSLLYWIIALAIPAWRLLEGLALGNHLDDPEPSSIYQNAQALILLVFIGFAFLLHSILDELSKPDAPKSSSVDKPIEDSTASTP